MTGLPCGDVIDGTTTIPNDGVCERTIVLEIVYLNTNDNNGGENAVELIQSRDIFERFGDASFSSICGTDDGIIPEIDDGNVRLAVGEMSDPPVTRTFTVNKCACQGFIYSVGVSSDGGCVGIDSIVVGSDEIQDALVPSSSPSDMASNEPSPPPALQPSVSGATAPPSESPSDPVVTEVPSISPSSSPSFSPSILESISPTAKETPAPGTFPVCYICGSETLGVTRPDSDLVFTIPTFPKVETCGQLEEIGLNGQIPGFGCDRVTTKHLVNCECMPNI
mmetsp:Transcript_51317/g.123876  ORF Transcript_51317/g.123876 Transcript_51317/m.123876 type:complete len:279 (-) Transcript_51317:187-1023(-)